MKLAKSFNAGLGLHCVEAVTDRGFINRMWFDDEPDLDVDEWLDYLHEETLFREELWIQSGRFKPAQELNDTTSKMEDGTQST